MVSGRLQELRKGHLMGLKSAATGTLFAGLAIGLMAACGADTSSSGSDELTFEVGGSAEKADVTYMKNGLNIAQEENASVPWKKTEKFPDGTLGVNMNAQNKGGGDISCKIKDSDGKALVENTSKGEYAVVSCAVPS